MEDSQLLPNDTSQQYREHTGSSNNMGHDMSVDSVTGSADILASMEEVKQRMQGLLGEMENLRQDFETKVKYDESKQYLIDTLHRELQVYREGLHFRILRPIFLDLITMYDDLGKLLDSMPRDSITSSNVTLQNLASFQDTIEEILRRNGVQTFAVPENVFLASRQRIQKLVPIPDPAMDKQIARRVRKGFEYEGKLLRPETVEVYKYTPPTDR